MLCKVKIRLINSIRLLLEIENLIIQWFPLKKFRDRRPTWAPLSLVSPEPLGTVCELQITAPNCHWRLWKATSFFCQLYKLRTMTLVFHIPGKLIRTGHRIGFHAIFIL